MFIIVYCHTHNIILAVRTLTAKPNLVSYLEVAVQEVAWREGVR